MEDDLINAGAKLEWTEETATIEDIEQRFGFPQIVKTTSETASRFNVPADEPVLLVMRRNPIRLVAQTVEEGHYVMGKQITIPSEYSGLFRLSDHFERTGSTLKSFRSIQEVSDAFPTKVYVQEQLTVTLSTDESSGKFITVVLEKGDELTIISRLESSSSNGNICKPASRFISRVRRLQHNFLVVHCTRLDESLSLPMSIQGWFATHPPLFVHLLERKGIISLQQLMEQADFPLTVSVSTNSTRSFKDDFLLRSGMHLKLLGLEEHCLVLAVAPLQKIVEFADTGVTFRLPAALTNTDIDNDKERLDAKNQYQTFVQSAFIQSKLENSPSNIDEYCMSVLFYVTRNRNPTNPKPLTSNAFLRNLTLSSQQLRKVSSHQEISAIHLLTSQPIDGQMQRDRRMSGRQSNSMRRKLPTPDGSDASSSNPPLPPRNSPLPLNPAYGNVSFAPPVPPKNRSNVSYFDTPPPSFPADLPQRPAPLPNLPSSMREPTHVSDNSNSRDRSEEENIFEEFVPLHLHSRPPLPPVNNDCPLALENDDALSYDSTKTSESESSLAYSVTSDPGLPPVAASSRIDSPCFTLPSPTSNSNQRHFANSYENVELNASERNDRVENRSFSSNGSPEVPIQSAEQTHLQPEVVVTEQFDRGSESDGDKSRASGVANNVRVNGIDTDDVPLSIASNTSSIENPSDFPKRGRRPSSKDYLAPPSNWLPPADVTSMNVDEVTASLRYIGITESAVQFFRDEMIDGVILSDLTDDMLLDDFNLSKLHRFKIRRFVQGWRPKLPGS